MMDPNIEIGTEVVGAYGKAVRLDLNPEINPQGTTLAWWLITGPWHPAWPQFVLCVVHLRPVDGVPEAKLHFPGATHELSVMALNPGDPPKVHDAATLEAGGIRAVGGYLQPMDVVHQFTATDDEMVALANLCAQGCVHGVLNPSTDDARERLREHWLSACVKTLAHLRGEEHAQ